MYRGRQVGVCFAPTIRHRSPPEYRRHHPGGAGDGPPPLARDLPENQYSYRPPPQPRPASQPPPAPPTFHATHPLTPFSSADSHSGFAASSSHDVPPLEPLPSLIHLYPSTPILRRVSLTVTLTLVSTDSPSHSAYSCHYVFLFFLSAPPRVFLLALPSLFLSLPSSPYIFFSLSLSVYLFPSRPSMPQGLAVFFSLACRLGQPPLLAKRSL